MINQTQAIHLLTYAVLTGIVMGISAMCLLRDWWRMKVDEKLKERLAYLDGELLRLRTFHAMHVGEEQPCPDRRVVYLADLRKAA